MTPTERRAPTAIVEAWEWIDTHVCTTPRVRDATGRRRIRAPPAVTAAKRHLEHCARRDRS